MYSTFTKLKTVPSDPPQTTYAFLLRCIFTGLGLIYGFNQGFGLIVGFDQGFGLIIALDQDFGLINWLV